MCLCDLVPYGFTVVVLTLLLPFLLQTAQHDHVLCLLLPQHHIEIVDGAWSGPLGEDHLKGLLEDNVGVDIVNVLVYVLDLLVEFDSAVLI